jgi:hypothetical protein
MKNLKSILWLPLLFSLSWIQLVYAAEFEDLDGTYIEAIEEYPSIKKNEISAGFSYLPFEAFYYGYGINGSYTRYLNKNWAWEVISGVVIFRSEKGVTTALVDDFNASPETIDQADYAVGSNMKYVVSYGKNIFFDKFIRQTRTEIVAGLGSIAISSNLETNNFVTLNLGAQFDFAISDHFSWKFEFINYYPVTRANTDFLDYGIFRLMLAWRFK